MYDEKILPVEEMVAWEEFTDRVDILRELTDPFPGQPETHQRGQ